MKIAIETLGCKLNQAETEAIARQFTEAGHEIVDATENPEIYILNTCTVTGVADSKSRHLLRLAQRRNPDAAVVATGCYAERAEKELGKVEGVTLVAGNEAKHDLPGQLRKAGLIDGDSLDKENHAGKVLPRTRAFVKIQEGCSNYCTYCIVPYVRSTESSVKSEKVLETVRQRVDEGHQEIVLTGTRIGVYQDEDTNLKRLIKRVLSETAIRRLRLSSLQPREISNELIGLWEDKRLCPHFHMSLQSGSASVLPRMNRLYTIEQYKHTINNIREKIPDVAITTDIIIGFPGETEKEFEESLAFCRKIAFARIHVFPYSARSGTKAAEMPGQISENVKKERTDRMLALAKQCMAEFRTRFSGRTLDVLWEKQTDKGVWSGTTGNYIRVTRKDGRDLANKITKLKLD